MIFAGRAELRRILRENKGLKARQTELEAELREERETARRMILELTNRVLTAAGCYALPKEVTEPRKAEPKKTDLEPSPVMEAYLEAVRQEGIKLGKSHGEIEIMINRLRRGESVIPELDEEFVLPN